MATVASAAPGPMMAGTARLNLKLLHIAHLSGTVKAATATVASALLGNSVTLPTSSSSAFTQQRCRSARFARCVETVCLFAFTVSGRPVAPKKAAAYSLYALPGRTNGSTVRRLAAQSLREVPWLNVPKTAKTAMHCPSAQPAAERPTNGL